MIKRFDKKENLGITLIALVITIIILLILAGVTIGIATNGTGLFEKAKLATDEYNNSVEKENIELENATNEIDDYIQGNRNDYSNEWTLYKKVTGTETVNIDFSKYKNVKFLMSHNAGNSTNPQWRVVETTVPTSFLIEKSSERLDVLLGAHDSWLYGWVYVINNTYHVGGGYEGSSNVTNYVDLYVYVQ